MTERCGAYALAGNPAASPPFPNCGPGSWTDRRPDAMAVAIGPDPYRIQAPPLPDGAYERLLNHEQVNVRYETVVEPSTLELLADPATEVAAAANPALPPAEMGALLYREGIPR
ncbi:hypothetical protein [Streptomyces arboris]|uniref:Uncharacterized protein n=1 Tax=Streptomyces arboris TaxID=2600619 RepID=A0A5N5EUR6_9ACTN|nr:hypothetical protein [Streptomyces arboris]KAB2592482.1 hypothetical protein F5983_10325 [Streptomyces arboris]